MPDRSGTGLIFNVSADASGLKTGLEAANQQIDEFVKKVGGVTKTLKTLSDDQKAAAKASADAMAKTLGLNAAGSRTPLVTAYAAGLGISGGDEAKGLEYMRAKGEHLAKITAAAKRSIEELFQAQQRITQEVVVQSAVVTRQANERIRMQETLNRLVERNSATQERTIRLTMAQSRAIRIAERLGQDSVAEQLRQQYSERQRSLAVESRMRSDENNAYREHRLRTEAAANRLRQQGERASEHALREQITLQNQQFAMMRNVALMGSSMIPGGAGRFAAGASMLGPTGLGIGIGAGVGAAGLMLGDERNRQEMRFSSLPGGLEATKDALASVYQIAQKTGVALSETVPLYQGIVRSAKDLGLTTNQAEKLVLTIQQLGIISGTSTEAMKFGLRQMIQALGMGVVHAEEFNSMMENTPEIVQKIADVLTKGSVPALRQLIITQKVLSVDLAQALDKVKVNAEEMYMPLTNVFTAIGEKTKSWLIDLLRLDDVAKALSKEFQSMNNWIPNPSSLEPLDEKIARKKRELAIQKWESESSAQDSMRYQSLGPMGKIKNIFSRFSSTPVEEQQKEIESLEVLARKKDLLSRTISKSETEASELLTKIAGGAAAVLTGSQGSAVSMKDISPRDLFAFDPEKTKDYKSIYEKLQGDIAAIAKVDEANFLALNNIQDPKAKEEAKAQTRLENEKALFQVRLDAERSLDELRDKRTKASQSEEHGKRVILDMDARLLKMGEDSAIAEKRRAMHQASQAGNFELEAKHAYEIAKQTTLKAELTEGITDQQRQQIEAYAEQNGLIAQGEVLDKRRAQLAKDRAQSAEAEARKEEARMERVGSWMVSMKDKLQATNEDIQSLSMDPTSSRIFKFTNQARKLNPTADEMMAATGLAEKNVAAEMALENKKQAMEESARYDFEAKYTRRKAEIAKMQETGQLSLRAQTEMEKAAYMERLAASDYWLDGVKAGMLEYGETTTNAAKMAKDVVVDSFKSMGDALATWAVTGEITTKKMVNSMLFDFSRLTIHDKIMGPLSQAAGGLLGSLFGGGGSGGLGTSGGSLIKEMVTASAFGNAFHNGSIVAMANGGIINGPTLRPMALMGESGPEAVMPLTRGKGGKLGVIANGGGGSNVVVNVIESPGKGGQRQESNVNGVSSITVFVEQIESHISQRMATGQGTLGPTMESVYGARRGGR